VCSGGDSKRNNQYDFRKLRGWASGAVTRLSAVTEAACRGTYTKRYLDPFTAARNGIPRGSHARDRVLPTRRTIT